MSQHLEAEKAILEALEVAQKIGDQELIAEAWWGLGRTRANQGNWEAAQTCGVESLKVFEAIGHYKAQDVHNWLGSL